MTLVFLHGAGCTHDVFAAQRERFSDAIFLRLPGHDAPGSADSIEGFADSIEAQLHALHIEAAVLCGSSMGGAIVLELALRRSPCVGALLLLGSSARLRVAPSVLESLGENFSAGIAALVPHLVYAPTPQIIQALADQFQLVGQEQTLADFRACDRFDVRERLGEITLPTLALVGEHDVMTPPKFSLFLADRIPSADARILPACGHLAMLEQALATNEAIAAFVSSL